MEHLLDRRLVLVTGKGGVGKSTVSAALALVAARAGKRAVVCEIEGPSAVAPLLGATGHGHAPRPIGEGVELAVLTAEEGLRSYLADRIRLPGIVDLVFKQPAVSKFFRAAPAFAEMGILYSISKLLDEKDARGRPAWDHVIVDLPASGHAVGMLEAPFIGKRIFLAGPVRHLCESMERMLLDHDLATCAVVTLPEELPVNEALELAAKLRDRGLRVEAVLANAVESEPLEPEEHALVEKLRALEHRPLLEGVAVAARRAARGRAILGRLTKGLRKAPVPISFRLERGRELVKAIAQELETAATPAGNRL
ncbi:ArsA family ATPase [Vulgatibacter incomptus]|uniref:arsenite-transporting ATPase n=1 Tax=Vulgatibacter incomptus TaxID=1391653 RepID=A0A0K1PF36_9BACT|nr:ArsA-related P-loop ATPase [Vulgatibacter incomptus]AKU92036.1 Arsenical pump-driving ATPase [Vulgatibacter incomptus]